MNIVELRFVSSKLPAPSAILNGAADLIEERGWKPGRGLGVSGEIDAIGAMRLATAAALDLTGLASVSEIAAGCVEFRPESNHRAVDAQFDAAVHLVAERIGVEVDERFDTEGSVVCRWHDRRGRTAAEVVSVLREAAALSTTQPKEN